MEDSVNVVCRIISDVLLFTPVPCISKLYGFSLASSLAILMLAERVPTALGSKVIWKVVESAAAILFEGIAVTEKSLAFAPLIVI